MAGILDNLFAALQEAQTPWAQEALRRMSTGQDLSGIDEEMARRRPQSMAASASPPRQAPPPSADVRNPGVDPFSGREVRMATTVDEINAGTSPAAPDGVSPVTAPVAAPQVQAAPVAQQPVARAQPAQQGMPDFSEGAGPLMKMLGLDKLGFGGGERRRVQELAFNTLVQKGIPRDQAELFVRQPKLLAQIVPKLVSDQPKPTDEMREYQFERQQRLARGESPESIPVFGEWKAGIRKAGAQSVNIDQRGQSEFEKGVGKAQAERLDGFVKAGSAARTQLASIDAAQAALDQYNSGSFFGSGKLGPAEATVRAYAQSLGIGNATTASAAELSNAIQNRRALEMRNPDAGLGMPGALSDADREFLRTSQAGLDKTPEGNRLLLEMERRVANRKIELASLAERYARENKNLTGFEDFVTAHYKDKPLFADLYDKAKGSAPAQAPRNGQFKILGVR